MRTTLFAILITACMPGLEQTQADVITLDYKTPGDGLITRDEESGLEWLDITETRASYNDLTAGMVPGGAFQGWRHASISEFESLMIKFGYTTLSDMLDNGAAVLKTYSFLGSVAGNVSHIAFGPANVLDNWGNQAQRHVRLNYDGPTPNRPLAKSEYSMVGVGYSIFRSEGTVGHALVRLSGYSSVPEPDVWLLCTISTAAICTLHSRKRLWSSQAGQPH
jgi:hypothetical protein